MDPYSVLDVSKSESLDNIKKIYKKKAIKYHPDKAPQEKKEKYEKKFKLYKEAYEQIIKDKENNINHKNLFDDFFNFDIFDQMEKKMNNMKLNNNGNYYSKSVYISNINGKKMKKVEENINGNIHQYEEFDTRNNKLQIK